MRKSYQGQQRLWGRSTISETLDRRRATQRPWDYAIPTTPTTPTTEPQSIENCCPVIREMSEHRKHCHQEAPRTRSALLSQESKTQFIAHRASSTCRATRLAPLSSDSILFRQASAGSSCKPRRKIKWLGGHRRPSLCTSSCPPFWRWKCLWTRMRLWLKVEG